jgi:hypothetical protein
MGDVVDRSWSAARVRGGAFSAGHRYGGVRAASAHYFSTHGSSRFGAEDAAMSSVCSRENWARKAERGVKTGTGMLRWLISRATRLATLAYTIPLSFASYLFLTGRRLQ